MKSKNILKIGDRVRVRSMATSYETGNPKITIGMIGTVKRLDGAFVGVEFDDDVCGHHARWAGKQGYCWYILHKELEKIGETDTKEAKEERMDTDKEMVNHPSHYTSGKVECIDAIESATGELTGIEAVCTANIIKYVWRWKLKNGVEDLEKASWYLNKLIEKKKDDKYKDEIRKSIFKNNDREKAIETENELLERLTELPKGE